MEKVLQIIQLILAVILICLVLLQQRGSGLGLAFGGEGNVYRSRRGIEKLFFILTIIVSILFCGSALVTIFIV